MFNIKFIKIFKNDEISVGIEANGDLIETAADSSRKEFWDMLPFEEAYILDHMLDHICGWDNNGRCSCPLRCPEHHMFLADLEHEDEEWEPCYVPILHEK